MHLAGRVLAFLFLFGLFIWLFHMIDTAGEGDGQAQAESSQTFDSRRYDLTERETGVRHANPAKGELADDWGE